MDTLTHALSGALLASATDHDRQGPGQRRRMVAGLVAASFPDVDYLFYWLIPSEFLNLHRGPTHSLILLPLWALLLAVVLARLTRGRRWQAFYGVCTLGLAVHILGDVITIYGTKIFSPVSDLSLALELTFDVDPYLAAFILAGFVGLMSGRRPARVAGMTLMAVAGYLLLQAVLHWQTMALAETFKERHGLLGAKVHALPQPLSPFTWKVVIVHGDRYFVAYLNYLPWNLASEPSEDSGWLRHMLVAYQPLDALHWTERRRFGAATKDESIARQVWQQERFAPFRRFTVLPALYRIERQDGELCAWFTDLRHALPAIQPAFRYGMCRPHPNRDWQLYRLRYFSHNDRQLLE